ncbi:MAG: sigma-70 family RNA polymerase sigma factor [Armatimonadetes bacterium]|nr:sigma-70 family RNA polymerase sigma factor [Armatimonadota bacterium]
MDSRTDEELVKRAAGGDGEAFVALVKRHEQPLLALLRRLVPADERDDVWQEALAQAWLGIGRLERVGAVRAWLLMVVRNRAREWLRRTGWSTEALDDQQADTAPSAFGPRSSGGSRARDAVDALAELGEAGREAARLFYLEGLSIAEIAERTGRPAGTVKRRLFDARTGLRRILGVTLKEEDDEPLSRG